MRHIIIIFAILLLLLTLISGFGGGVSTRPTYNEQPAMNYNSNYESGTMLKNTREHYYDSPSNGVLNNPISGIHSQPVMVTPSSANPVQSTNIQPPVMTNVTSETPSTFVKTSTIEPFEEMDNTYARVD